MLRLIRLYLKVMYKNSDERALRLEFLGKGRQRVHYQWLHFNRHPWERVKE